jgi:hypothetical protein
MKYDRKNHTQGLGSRRPALQLLGFVQVCWQIGQTAHLKVEAENVHCNCVFIWDYHSHLCNVCAHSVGWLTSYCFEHMLSIKYCETYNNK